MNQVRKLGLLLLMLGLSAAPAFSWPAVYPLGTTRYNPQQSFNGYTLFSPISDKPYAPQSTLYLIDMSGKVVHQWDVPFSPVLHGRLLPNGNVIIIGQNNEQKPGRPGVGKYWMGGAAGWLVELTWEGKRVFEHVDLNMHHDFVKLSNGNTIYLAWEPVPAALRKKVRGGLAKTEHKDGTMYNDVIIEINPQKKVVWKWHANDHLNPDIDIIGPIYNRDEWLHTNSLALLDNGNILLTNRSTDSVMIIDKKSGKIVSRFGNAVYLDKKIGQIRQRKLPQTLGGPHDAQQIPAGYLGAGNILVLDNGVYTHKTRALVFDPATGKPVGQWPAGGQFGRPLFSYFLGSVQPLPNNNLFICDGANGRFLQAPVSAGNEIVWEYVNPYTPTPQINGCVFKAHLYGQDYCPQFRQLPPAQGRAVDLPNATVDAMAHPAEEKSVETPPETSADSPAPSTPASGDTGKFLALLLTVSVLANAFLWQKLRRSR